MNVRYLQETFPIDGPTLELLDGLWSQGFVLDVQNDELVVTPEDRLSAQGRAEIEERREGLVSVLRAMESDAALLRQNFCDHAELLETAGLSREQAWREAAKSAAYYAHLKGFPWFTLRMTFAPYPELAVPARVGVVDDLPLFLSGEAMILARGRLLETLRAACEGIEGITAEVMADGLTPTEWREILAGLIPTATLRAYAACLAKGGNLAAFSPPLSLSTIH